MDKKKSSDTSSPSSGTSLGSFLQQERAKKNISIEQVADSTCIHIATLRAIEASDRDKMPAEVFSRGFVKLYAEFLGLDTQDIMDRYNKEMVDMGGTVSEDNDQLTGRSYIEKPPFFTLPKIILLIVLFILFALGYYSWAGNESDSSRKSRNVYFEKYYVEKNSSPETSGGSEHSRH
jgi:cytoskeleton protein RodZ